MPKLVSVQCPNCGAPLELDPGSPSATCGYCKTTSHVKKGGPPGPPSHPRPFVAGVPPPPPPAMAPIIHVPKQSGAGCVVAAALGGLVLVAGVGAAVFLVAARGASSSSSFSVSGPSVATGPGAAAKTPDDDFQFSSKVFLADVDGDGAMDAIGLNRSFVDGEQHWVAAFESKKGKRLWRTEEIDKSVGSWEGRAGLIDRLFVTVDALGKVRTFDVKTGKAKWKATVSERAETLCGGDGFIGVVTQDKGFVAFDAKSGKPRSGVDRKSCGRIQTTEDGNEAGARVVSWSELEEVGLPRSSSLSLDGFSVSGAVAPDDSPVRFLFVTKQPGSNVPMILAHDGKKQHWLSDVPSSSPLDAEGQSGTIVAGYGRGRVVTLYKRKTEEGLRLVCLDAATGKHTWDVAVPKNPGDVPEGIAVSDRDVFFTTWTHLHVYALKTGKRKYSIGQF